MSISLRPHGLQPTRLLCPWDFPGKSTGVECHFLLHILYISLCNLPFKYYVIIYNCYVIFHEWICIYHILFQPIHHVLVLQTAQSFNSNMDYCYQHQILYSCQQLIFPQDKFLQLGLTGNKIFFGGYFNTDDEALSLKLVFICNLTNHMRVISLF